MLPLCGLVLAAPILAARASWPGELHLPLCEGAHPLHMRPRRESALKVGRGCCWREPTPSGAGLRWADAQCVLRVAVRVPETFSSHLRPGWPHFLAKSEADKGTPFVAAVLVTSGASRVCGDPDGREGLERVSHLPDAGVPRFNRDTGCGADNAREERCGRRA